MVDKAGITLVNSIIGRGVRGATPIFADLFGKRKHRPEENHYV
jgi:hypothetical protein